MKLEQAQKLAEQIIDRILSFCDRVEVAGSIRRRKSEVRDVDLVIIPKPLLKHRIIATLQRTMNAKVLKRGDKVAQLIIDGVNVDLYSATKENFASLLFIRTGSAQSNMRLASKARSMGLKFSHYGVFNGDERVDDNTEEGIYRALGLSYKPPEERE